ncbi:unnamed protein product [Lampetra planeri]
MLTGFPNAGHVTVWHVTRLDECHARHVTRGCGLETARSASSPATNSRAKRHTRCRRRRQQQQLGLAKDLLHPSLEAERRCHKKKRLVQSPNSYFMDVKCPGCYKITTVFSHAQTVVLCVGCSTVLCQPTGGKARLTEGCSFRRKQH